MALVPVALGVVLLTSGCASSTSFTTRTAGSPAPITTIVPPPSTSVPVASTVPPAAPLCSTAQLTGSIGSPDGTAGGVDFHLVLRDSGSAACVLAGYPRLSTVAGPSGPRVGAFADEIVGPDLEIFTLQPGHTATAVISVADVGHFPASCHATAATGFRVYPPSDAKALYVPRRVSTCVSTRYKTLGVGSLDSS